MSVKALPSTGVGPVHCRLVGVRQALGEGWRVLRRAPQISLAYGGVFAKVRWLKRQHLAFFSQGRFNFQ